MVFWILMWTFSSLISYLLTKWVLSGKWTLRFRATAILIAIVCPPALIAAMILGIVMALIYVASVRIDRRLKKIDWDREVKW